MKKLLIILLVISNTSFIDSPKRYWQGCTIFLHEIPGEDDRTVITEIIQADNEKAARAIFNTQVKSLKQLKGLQQTMYIVYEIKAEDILR